MLLDDANGTHTKYQNGPGIDNKLSLKTGSAVSYFLVDHLGSTNGLADATGSLTAQTAYDSFGNQTANLPTRYGFTGRERDDFTGLMHYRARHYDPRLGRFTSEDPTGFGGGDVNLYGYVWNNPLQFTDPLGEQGWPIWDNYWHWYYSKKCAETGIAAACDLNRNDQNPEQLAQEAFNRGVGSVSGLRFKVGYADNPYCRLAEEYAGYSYAGAFPTNVQRVDPHGSVTESAMNVAKTQKLGKATRAWNWATSWWPW